MRNTLSAEFRVLLLLLLLVGCRSGEGTGEPTLEQLRHRVRERMLKFQSAEILNTVASERYEPALAASVTALAGGYRENRWTAEDDPALQELEKALTYALVVLSPTPAVTAEKLAADQLDLAVALRVARLQRGERDGAAAELAMMTDWPVDKVRRWSRASVPPAGTGLFPVHPESERMLDQYGNAAAFRMAADLYRTPSAGTVRQAERLRRAILNRYLMRPGGNSSDRGHGPSAARLRGRLFEAELAKL